MTIDELIRQLEDLSVITGGDAEVHLVEQYWEVHSLPVNNVVHNPVYGRVEITV